MIEHVEDDLKFLIEIRRIMKKGAKLLLETPNMDRLSNKMKGLVKPVKYPLILGEGCVHIREYSKNSLKKLLKVAGFKNVRIKGVWLGLRGRFEVGISKFPGYLEKIFAMLVNRSISMSDSKLRVLFHRNVEHRVN